jgi:hypothetical protein
MVVLLVPYIFYIIIQIYLSFVYHFITFFIWGFSEKMTLACELEFDFLTKRICWENLSREYLDCFCYHMVEHLDYFWYHMVEGLGCFWHHMVEGLGNKELVAAVDKEWVEEGATLTLVVVVIVVVVVVIAVVVVVVVLEAASCVSTATVPS